MPAPRADHLKDRLWTVGSWLVALQLGLLAFLLDQALADILSLSIPLEKLLLILLVVVIGLYLGRYSFRAIEDYDDHVRRNWIRADHLLGRDSPASSPTRTSPAITLNRAIQWLRLSFCAMGAAALATSLIQLIQSSPE